MSAPIQVKNLLDHPTYDPNRLFDLLIELFRVKNDRHLAEKLSVTSSTISKVRHKTLAIPGTLVVQILELTEMRVSEINAMMGIKQRVRY